MFVLPSVLIVYSVLAFGAVSAYQFLLLDWLCLAVFAIYACVSIARRGRAEALWVPAVGVLALSAGAVKHAPALMIGTWMVLAARRSSPKQADRFILLLIGLGVFEALLGLVQYAWAPGWVWGYHNPFFKAAGTLANRNHYAGLLEMLIPAAVGGAYCCLLTKTKVERAPLYLLAALLMASTVLASLSRMGIFSLTISIFTMSVLARGRSAKRQGHFLGATLAGVLVFSVLWAGIDSLLNRFDREELTREGRVAIFQAAGKLIWRSPLGVGAGRFDDMVRQYQFADLKHRYDHAHNDYIEFAAEFGIPGLILGLGAFSGALVLMVRRFLRSPSPRIRGYLLASIGAITAIIVHSFADFNLQIPGNALVFASLLGFGLGTALRPDPVYDEH